MITTRSVRNGKSRRAWTAAVSVGLAAAAAFPVTAQERDLTSLSLADLMQVEIAPVFGASQRLQPVTEAPASVTIVTASDIVRFGYQTLGDILRSVRGFYVTYDRNYSYVGVRGVGQAGDYNTRILLLVDGHRMNDSIYDQAAIGTEAGLDPRSFERVEIIRGPASSLYGTSAFYAVVNVITKTGASLDGAAASVEAGSFGTEVVRASVGRRLASGVDFALFAATGNSHGPSRLHFPEFDDPGVNQGVAVDLDDDQFHDVFGRMAAGNLTVRGAFGTRDKGVPTAAYGTIFGDPRLRTTDARAFVDAQYERSIGAARVSLRSYVDRYRYEGSYPYAADDDSSTFEEDSAEGIWWGGDARISRPVGTRHALQAGIELRHNARQVQEYGLVGEPPTLDLHDTSHLVAAYVQDEFRVSSRLLVNAGLRYDEYVGFSRFAPRVGVIVPTSANQSFKYLYGNAFRAPNAYESHYFVDTQDNLRPETINTHELVWERYTSTWLRTAIAAWRSDVHRLITLISTPDEALAFVNRGRARVRGLDFEAELRLPSGLQAVVSHAAQRSRNPVTDAPLPNSPRQLTQARLSLPGPFDILGSLEVQRIGVRRTLSGARVAPATLAGLTVRWPVTSQLTLTGSARNVFDVDYADPASEEHLQDVIRQDGRTIRVGLEWRVAFR